MAVYEEHLRAGLRFPLHPFVANILDFFRVVPAQLTPNSIRNIVGFVILCHLLGVRPRASLFRAFFVIRHHPRDGGWWFIGPRHNRVLLHGLPSSIHGWKPRFFFVSRDRPWGSRWAWQTPREGPNANSSVAAEDAEDFNRLRDMDIPHIRELLTEQNLFDAGLSSVSSLDMRKISIGAAREVAAKREAAVAMKRKADQTEKPKRAVAKRPCSEVSAGRPSIVTESPDHPRTAVAEGPTPREKAKAPAQETAPKGKGPRGSTIPLGGPGDSSAPARGGAAMGRKMSVHRHQDGEDQVLQTRVGPNDSGLHDPVVARELVKMTMLPRDVEELRARPIGEIASGIYPNIIKIIHDVTTMRTALNRYAEFSSTWEARLKEAEDRVAGCDRRLKEAADREAASQKEAADREAVLRKEVADLRNMAEYRYTELTQERGRAADLEARLERSESLRHQAEGQKTAAEARVKMLEEAKSSIAERAVEEYKNSDAFEADAAEASADVYMFGFQDCRAKIAQEFPLLDLSRIRAPGEADEEGEDTGIDRAPGSQGGGVSPNDDSVVGTIAEPVVIPEE